MVRLTLKVYPGNGEFLLYEDDGVSNNYKDGTFAVTKISTSLNSNDLNVKIAMHEGMYDIIPSNRTYNLEISLPNGNKIIKKGLFAGTDTTISLDSYQDMLNKSDTLADQRQRILAALLDFNLDNLDKDRVYNDILPLIFENPANAVRLSKMLSAGQIRMTMELINMECVG